jgi:hypothetical protein
VRNSKYFHGGKLHHCFDHGAYWPPGFRILEKASITQMDMPWRIRDQQCQALAEQGVILDGQDVDCRF